MNSAWSVKSSVRSWVWAALLFGFGGAPPAAGGGAKWGAITYPLPANVRAEAGTLLVHFRIEADPRAKPGPWFYPARRGSRFHVAHLSSNPGNPVWIYWRGSMWTHVTRLPGRPGPNLRDQGGRISSGWQAYEPHWVAFSWDAEGVIAYWLDGERAEWSQVNPPGIGPVTADGRLTLGPHESAITVYAVHILGHALREDELQNISPAEVDTLFQPREGTLLLDRFDQPPFQPDGTQQTRAVSISGISGETGGVPTSACQFVDTPDGRGLRLYTPPQGIQIP